MIWPNDRPGPRSSSPATAASWLSVPDISRIREPPDRHSGPEQRAHGGFRIRCLIDAGETYRSHAPLTLVDHHERRHRRPPGPGNTTYEAFFKVSGELTGQSVIRLSGKKVRILKPDELRRYVGDTRS